VFRSFFQAGFEGTTGFNRHGEWVDQIEATQHDLFVNEDYRRLRDLGILTIRESVRWPLVNPRLRRYDFTSLDPFLEASERYNIEIIYDLFHFGYPGYLDLFSADFPKYFAEYCHAVTEYIVGQTPQARYFTPLNEPSFFAFAAGEVGLFAPHQCGRGWELKVILIRALIQGINAIRAAHPHARIVNADPLCRAVPPFDQPDLAHEAETFNSNVVFQSWDMLCGRLMPELGGSAKHLDIVGINYYWTNQWEWQCEWSNGCRALSADDPRHARIGSLVRLVWERYGAEMVITETSDLEERRAAWIGELAADAKELLDQGIPLHGICLYPILGMPEWHARDEWSQMGLWELRPNQGWLERVPHKPMMDALRNAQWLENHRSRTIG
jgi:beta-glucosidase/6-phospho-beta-glucosidase/beta-galactosidase